jgi:hypothetical protein
MYIRQYANDPVAEQLLRMEVMISPPRKSIGEYKLNPVEYTDYQRIVGKIIHKMMGNAIRSPVYRSLPAIYKRDRLTKVRNDAVKLGRKIFLLRNPTIMFKSGSLLQAERVNFEERDLLID